MNNELIDQIAKARGIETKYLNAWGKMQLSTRIARLNY